MTDSGSMKIASLLEHLVEITGHRDHDLLDISTMSALLNMIGVKEARILELFQSRGDLLVRPRVWIADGKVQTSDEDHTSTEHPCEPIVSFPSLVSCIAQHKNRAEEMRADGSHALWIPIWQNDKVSTCLEIVNSQGFTPQMLQVMEGILSVYRNYQSLLDYSERDSLTGLLNRKTFDEKFARMINSRMSEPANSNDRRHVHATSQWLAVVDIDHFKRVNDRFGHLYGDEVLILVANVLRSSFRAQDRVFRFGGEEFVILLRSTTLDEARMIFDRFRSNVEQHSFPQVGQITVSIGFACITQETPVVILGHADQALYHAKDNGRNRVCYYDELVSQGLIGNNSNTESVEFFFDEPVT